MRYVPGLAQASRRMVPVVILAFVCEAGVRAQGLDAAMADRVIWTSGTEYVLAPPPPDFTEAQRRGEDWIPLLSSADQRRRSDRQHEVIDWRKTSEEFFENLKCSIRVAMAQPESKTISMELKFANDGDTTHTLLYVLDHLEVELLKTTNDHYFGQLIGHFNVPFRAGSFVNADRPRWVTYQSYLANRITSDPGLPYDLKGLTINGAEQNPGRLLDDDLIIPPKSKVGLRLEIARVTPRPYESYEPFTKAELVPPSGKYFVTIRFTAYEEMQPEVPHAMLSYRTGDPLPIDLAKR